MYNLIKKMHTKFNLENNIGPTVLSKEESSFRILAMFEELFEYIDSVYSNVDTEILFNTISIELLRETSKLKENVDLQEQFDALIDLVVFTMGTAERQGFKFVQGFDEVMQANLKKELAGISTNSKRGFARDLIKPDGWQSPTFDKLMHKNPTGIIILDGPDCSGKTTLANYFVNKYNAKYFHLTWSEDLQKIMDDYQLSALFSAERESEEGLVIIDRLWLSELVYSDVFRGGTEYQGFHKTMMHLIDKMKAINIVCYPSDEKDYVSNFDRLQKERKEMYTRTFDAALVYKMYKALYEGDVDDNFISKVCNRIVMDYEGLKNRNGYYHYDFTSDGSDLETFTENMIKELEMK